MLSYRQWKENTTSPEDEINQAINSIVGSSADPPASDISQATTIAQAINTYLAKMQERVPVAKAVPDSYLSDLGKKATNRLPKTAPNTFKMKKEWQETESFCQSLVESRNLYNALYQMGVRRYVLMENTDDFEALRSVIGGHMQKLVARVKEITSQQTQQQQIPAAAMSMPTSGTASLAAPKASLPQSNLPIFDAIKEAISNKGIGKRKVPYLREQLKGKGIEFKYARDIITRVIDEVEKFTGESFDDKELVKHWVKSISKGDLPSGIVQRLGKIIDNAKPVPTPAPSPTPTVVPPQLGQPVSEPPRRSKPTVVEPPELPSKKSKPAVIEPEDDFGDDLDDLGDPSPIQWTHVPTKQEIRTIKDISQANQFTTYPAIAKLIKSGIDPLKIIEINPKLSRRIPEVLDFISSSNKKYGQYLAWLRRNYPNL